MSALYPTNPLTILFAIKRTVGHADSIYSIGRLREGCCGDRCQNSRVKYDCGGYVAGVEQGIPTRVCMGRGPLAGKQVDPAFSIS
jgi:hypothetical protein